MLTPVRTKMYKTRIKQWKLDKNHKANEMRAIVRKRAQQIEKGEVSNFRIRGRAICFAEVVRYWRRKGVSVDDIVARRRQSSTPEAVECSTPVPTTISTPEVLAKPEQMLLTLRDYYRASFENGTWWADAESLYVHGIHDSRLLGDLTKLSGNCNLAFHLFDDRQDNCQVSGPSDTAKSHGNITDTNYFGLVSGLSYYTQSILCYGRTYSWHKTSTQTRMRMAYVPMAGPTDLASMRLVDS